MFERSYLFAEWLIVGVRFPVPPLAPVGPRPGEEVMVLASNELTRAQLEMEQEFIEELFEPPLSRFVGRQTVTFQTELGRYTVCFGATYQDAMAKLMGMWQPEERFADGVLRSGDTVSIQAPPVMLGP